MTRRKWAVLGLSALALLAFSALAATGAQGNKQNPEFTCLENHVTHVECTGHGTNVAVDRTHNGELSSVHTFSAGFATLTCTTSTFSVRSDANGTDQTPEADPTYEGCTASPGALETHVVMNGCYYEFHPKHTSTETTAEDEYTGTVTLKCPAGESVEITITEGAGVRCHIELHEQANIGPIYFRSMTSADPTDVTVEAKTATASATFHPTGGTLLGRCGVFATTSNTRYTGNVTVQGENAAGNPIDLTLD